MIAIDIKNVLLFIPISPNSNIDKLTKNYHQCKSTKPTLFLYSPSPNPYNQAMLIITKIQTKELKTIGRADTREYEDLAIPAMEISSKKELVQEVIDAYDLGELTTLSHVSSPNVLKATVEKDNVAYHLSAKIHEE